MPIQPGLVVHLDGDALFCPPAKEVLVAALVDHSAIRMPATGVEGQVMTGTVVQRRESWRSKPQREGLYVSSGPHY